MPRLLRNTAGRLFRSAAGRLVTEGCADACCGGGPTCARAYLCESTDGYADVNPKTIIIPYPEGGRLCVNPAGPWLLQYKGRCYQPLYNEDGTLVEHAICNHDGVATVLVGDPAAELTCLPETGCDDSPCVEPYHPAECCERRPLTCNPSCGCDGTEVCDCGKRYIVIVRATWRHRLWQRQYAQDYGALCDDRLKTRTAAWVATYWGQDQPYCEHREFRGFGGTTESWYHGAACYGSEFTDVTYTPWVSGFECGEAWRAAFYDQRGPAEFCSGSYHRACTADVGGETWEYDGWTSCMGAHFEGYWETTTRQTCDVIERREWESDVFVQRLVECEDSRPGEPPSIAELGLF